MDIPTSVGETLYPVSRVIGYRREDHTVSSTEPSKLSSFRDNPWVKKVEDIIQSGIGAGVGLALIGLAHKAPAFNGSRSTPVIVGSFGAEAVLLFSSPASPLVQPRNIILSMSLSSIIGVAVTKLFAKYDSAFPNYSEDWIATTVAVVLSLMVTQLLNATHPPGGATALLATSNAQVVALGWFYCGYVMVGSCIMLGWALLINNIGRRRYPQYWISPVLETRESRGRIRLFSPIRSSSISPAAPLRNPFVSRESVGVISGDDSEV